MERRQREVNLGVCGQPGSYPRPPGLMPPRTAQPQKEKLEESLRTEPPRNCPISETRNVLQRTHGKGHRRCL